MVLFGYLEFFEEPKNHFHRILIDFFGVLLLMKDKGLVSVHIFKEKGARVSRIFVYKPKILLYGNKE